MKPTLDSVTKGVRPVWGDVAVVHAVHGLWHADRVRELGIDTIRVGDLEFRYTHVTSVESTFLMPAEDIMGHLAQIKGANLRVFAYWHGPNTPVIWKAAWEGVEQIDGGLLNQAVEYGNSPEEALRDLWRLVTTVGHRMVVDAYSTRGGRVEFSWNGLNGAWALDGPPTGE